MFLLVMVRLKFCNDNIKFKFLNSRIVVVRNMKFGALLVAGVAAYEQEWAEFQAVQGQRNGDIPAAFKKNVDLVKAHNGKESTFKMSYTGPHADKTNAEYKELLGSSRIPCTVIFQPQVCTSILASR